MALALALAMAMALEMAMVKIRYICPRCRSFGDDALGECLKFTADTREISGVPTFWHFNFLLTRDAKTILKKWGGDCVGFKEK